MRYAGGPAVGPSYTITRIGVIHNRTSACTYLNHTLTQLSMLLLITEILNTTNAI